MSTTTAEQVIVGKMSLPRAGGQMSPFSLPQDFAWLRQLSSEEIAEFLSELLDTVNRACVDQEWSLVAQVLESWKATAEIEADPELKAEIEQGLRELEAGQGVSWEELREELNL
ncbi:MAG: hypothetical protein GY835_10185 [bacterium]|nr:hypothetical protein [bacterium]